MISEEDILQTDFEGKDLARKYFTYYGFGCQGEEFNHPRFERKKSSYVNLIGSLLTPLKSRMVGFLSPVLSCYDLLT